MHWPADPEMRDAYVVIGEKAKPSDHPSVEKDLRDGVES